MEIKTKRCPKHESLRNVSDPFFLFERTLIYKKHFTHSFLLPYGKMPDGMNTNTALNIFFFAHVQTPSLIRVKKLTDFATQTLTK